jgi:hypothetical protein
MRSRPRVKTYIRPGLSRPGTSFDVDVVLTSAAETPIDFVELRLEGEERIQAGRYGRSLPCLAMAVRHGARTLGVDEHRISARFDLPGELPPTYEGRAASVAYTLHVHVSIPWWPDRHARYRVAVAPAPASQVVPTPQTILSTMDGPKGTAPFIEVALESTALELGGELAGAVSVANAGHSTIRGVDLLPRRPGEGP